MARRVHQQDPLLLFVRVSDAWLTAAVADALAHAERWEAAPLVSPVQELVVWAVALFAVAWLAAGPVLG